MSMERMEILSAEVFLDSLGKKVDASDIDAELERVNRELQIYQCDASMEDYAIAMLCGIMSGALDAFVLKQTDFSKESVAAAPNQLLACLQKAADSGKKASTVKPFRHSKVEKGFAEAIPELQALASHGSPAGFVSSLLCQYSENGMLRYQDDKLNLIPDGISKNNGIVLMCTGTIAASLKWLFNSTGPEAVSTCSLNSLDKLRKIMHASPAMSEVVKCVDKWQSQLPGEMKGCQKAMKREMSIDEIFISLLTAVSGMSMMKSTRLPEIIEKHRRAGQMGITSIPLAKALTQQAMPVILNEVLVRTLYFIVRLARQLSAHEDVNDIEWDSVVPFGNRTVERMIAIASATFTVADTADAAIHATVESAGDWVLFGGSFVKRFNAIGLGRAAIAVYREISYEQKEAELLTEKRLLTEEKAALVINQLEAYKKLIEERVSEYIAEDISAFLTGFSVMDQGLVTGNSNQVIKGNIAIQRVLGRDPQFVNQQEFDDLMASDMPLKF